MKKLCKIVCIFLYVFFICMGFAEDKHIMVIIPSYNNKNFYEKNLNSVLEQEYSNYNIIYIDDCSSDGTGRLVEEFIEKYNLQDRFILIKNQIRCLASRNIYYAIHNYCADDDIVVILDGDDWFTKKHALSTINNAYQDSEVWLTYGDHREKNGKGGRNPGMPQDVIDKNSYRKISWRVSHPRSYYAWLYKLIKLEDLQYQGAFIPMAQDFAKIYPMLEMSGGRFKYIQDVLYIYNTETSLHHFKINKGKPQSSLSSIIRNREPYKSLSQPLKKSNSLTASFSCCLILFSNLKKEACIAELQKLLSHEKEISKVYVYAANCTPDTMYIEAISIEFLALDKNINISSNKPFQEHDILQDYSILATDEIFSKKSLNIPFYVKFLRQTEGFVVSYAKYEQGQKQELKNTTLLQDNIFTFQLQWKPTLYYPYKEYGHLFVTKKLQEYFSNTYQLFTIDLQIQPQSHAHFSQNSGLMLMHDI